MLRTEITKEEYKVLAEYFAEYHPDIKVNLSLQIFDTPYTV